MADWYLKHGDKEYGPMDSNKLKQLAAQNKIRPTDYIRRGADGKWTLASHAKGLFNETVANDPTAPSPINVQSGDTNIGFSQSVPPVAPMSNPAYTQRPNNIQTPVAPPIATAIPVAQKANSSTSSSMSFGDGLEFNNSLSPSSPKRTKKGKKNASASTDNKTIIIASAAGGAVLVLILIIVLIVVRGGKKNNNVAPEEQTTPVQSDEGAANPAGEENVPAEPGDGEEPAEDWAPLEGAEDQDGQPSDQADASGKVYDSATETALLGDLEIKVVSVRQGTEPIVKKDGSQAMSPEKSTIIVLSVRNINPKKPVVFTPWSFLHSSGKNPNAGLTDNENNEYSMVLKAGELSKEVNRGAKELYSDDDSPVRDVLVFKRFVPGAKELFLTLSLPDAPGQSVVFSIKTENVGKSTDAAKPEADAAAEDSPQTGNPPASQAPPADTEPELTDASEDDDYNEVNGVSEEAQKRDQEEADAELRSLNLGD